MRGGCCRLDGMSVHWWVWRFDFDVQSETFLSNRTPRVQTVGKVSSRTCSPHEMTLDAMQRRTMCVRSEWQHAAVNVVGQPNIWCAFCVY